MQNITKYYGMMTKLIGLNPRVALPQVRPSQKEMQGAEDTLHFNARPHVNSRGFSAVCVPVDALC